MKQELQPLLLELCWIAMERNAINTRRHRARYRKNYYSIAVRVVEAHKGSNSALRSLNSERNQGAIAAIQDDMAALRAKYPKPNKWMSMGLHKLRSLVLQGEGEYAMAKHETMEHSIKYRARVKFITKTLKCSMLYSNGEIQQIIFKDTLLANFIYPKKIQEYAKQYELNMAVEGMLK